MRSLYFSVITVPSETADHRVGHRANKISELRDLCYPNPKTETNVAATALFLLTQTGCERKQSVFYSHWQRFFLFLQSHLGTLSSVQPDSVPVR